jgi:hypothetical protein
MPVNHDDPSLAAGPIVWPQNNRFFDHCYKAMFIMKLHYIRKLAEKQGENRRKP